MRHVLKMGRRSLILITGAWEAGNAFRPQIGHLYWERETLGCFITDLEEHTRKDILLISTAAGNLKMMSYVLPKRVSTWPIILEMTIGIFRS